MRRVWAVLQLLIAGGIAMFALSASWDGFVRLVTTPDIAAYMRAELMRASGGSGSNGVGSVSAGFAEASLVFSALPSLLLWRAYVWMAAANIGGRAARRLAGVHKWTAIVVAIVFLLEMLIAAVLMNTMGRDRGSLLVFALFLMPSLFLNAGVFVALAGMQAASALAGFAYVFGDNRAIA
jgi:hypothetical protein